MIAVVALLLGGCADKKESSVMIFGSVLASGEPVNAAAVLLTPGGGVKITGSNGLYEFTDIKPGRYELKVFKEGFQSFNQSVDVSEGIDRDVTASLTRNAGNLSINKSYIDMGSNASNNVAGFSIVNDGDIDLTWSITNAASWITGIEPTNGSVPANNSTSVVFNIDRSRLNNNTSENFATLVVRSTTTGDGSTAELLVTVFRSGDGTNTTISDAEYIVIDGLYIQTRDLGAVMNLTNANLTCQSSRVGGFNNWRVPTIGELSLMYSRREAIGGFNGTYWSSTYSGSSSGYYVLNFTNGQQSSPNSGNTHRCRCVRTGSLPSLTTQEVSGISSTTATLNGNIVFAGAPPYSERGFVYSSTNNNPTTNNDTKVVVTGAGTGSFSTTVSGLIENTTYYVRAYAINTEGTAYGEPVSFRVQEYIVLAAAGIAVHTADITSNAVDWGSARNLCQGSIIGGFNDWRLPTISELSTLYTNRVTIGGFSNINYWSNQDVGYPQVINFRDGSTGSVWNGSNAVRPVVFALSKPQPNLLL